MTIDELITKHYNHFSDSDLHISKYILNHKQSIPEMSIDKLAAKCLVSRSTIMRFAQKIGLDGYSELKALIKIDQFIVPDVKENFLDSVCEDDINAIRSFQKMDMEDICKKIYQSDTIYIYGTGSFQRAAANEFKRMFLQLGYWIHSIPGEGEFNQAIRLMKDTDLLIIISKDGESLFLKEKLKMLKLKGIPMISITKSGNNSLSKASDHNLSVAIDRHNLFEKYYYDNMILMYVVIKILFAKYVDYLKDKLYLD